MDIKTREESIANNLKKRGLDCPESLELFDYELEIRSVEEIARRAIISAIVADCAWYACFEDQRERTLEEHERELRKFKVYDNLFKAEKKIFEEEYNEDLCNNIAWESENAYALLWTLGFIDKIDDPSDPENPEALTDEMFTIVDKYDSFESFLKDCRLRSEEELADAFQLYWHYHWNCRDALYNFHGLSLEERERRLTIASIVVVPERRKALQWAVYSEEDDNGEWDFPLDT